MCEDLGGAGVQHAEQCGRAEFKSLYAYRGNGSKQDQSPSKARRVLRTGPLQFLPPRSRPFSCTPLLPDRPGLWNSLYRAPAQVTMTRWSARMGREESSGHPNPAEDRQIAFPAGR